MNVLAPTLRFVVDTSVQVSLKLRVSLTAERIRRRDDPRKQLTTTFERKQGLKFFLTGSGFRVERKNPCYRSLTSAGPRGLVDRVLCSGHRVSGFKSHHWQCGFSIGYFSLLSFSLLWFYWVIAESRVVPLWVATLLGDQLPAKEKNVVVAFNTRPFYCGT